MVFVHGIRGGAFATWRKESVGREVSSDKTACWPSAWLAKDVPQARLLGIEYAAPVSGWEVRTAAMSNRPLSTATVLVWIVKALEDIVVKMANSADKKF